MAFFFDTQFCIVAIFVIVNMRKVLLMHCGDNFHTFMKHFPVINYWYGNPAEPWICNNVILVVILQMLDNRYFCQLWCSRVIYTPTCSKSSLFSEDSFQVYPYFVVPFVCLAVVDCGCLYSSHVTFVTSFMEIGFLGSWHTDVCPCVTSSHNEVIERQEY